METSLQLSVLNVTSEAIWETNSPIFRLVARYVEVTCGPMWFGESIKQEVWKKAVKQSMTCDVMIIVGTSLVVSPANTLHFYAKNNQAAIVDINPENTPFSYEMDFSIRQTAVAGLSRLISIFESPF